MKCTIRAHSVLLTDEPVRASILATLEPQRRALLEAHVALEERATAMNGKAELSAEEAAELADLYAELDATAAELERAGIARNQAGRLVLEGCGDQGDEPAEASHFGRPALEFLFACDGCHRLRPSLTPEPIAGYAAAAAALEAAAARQAKRRDLEAAIALVGRPMKDEESAAEEGARLSKLRALGDELAAL